MPRVTTGPLNAIDGIRHAFFTRLGGVSGGIYASNNCGFGSKDDPAHVAENRARCADKLEVARDRLVTLNQIHSASVIEVVAPWGRDALPRADAMVTRMPGIALGVLSADCAPILLADATARVIGAAHAGWKGALTGVIEATIKAMVALGADPARMVAGIGPAIGKRSYEVSADFLAPFLALDPTNGQYFFPGAAADKRLFDLKGFVASRLTACAVDRVAIMPNDTFAEEDRFFSYRRACHRGESDYGRLLSAIALEP
ncbi:MAG: peptidoglycan editing factor PgeF [Alphaproteobacteria bacterium]|nr:peptidoglycan editing factor PgeF [Alphaproteobacteria bacterium]